MRSFVRCTKVTCYKSGRNVICKLIFKLAKAIVGQWRKNCMTDGGENKYDLIAFDCNGTTKLTFA
jgi:hypothetical protein